MMSAGSPRFGVMTYAIGKVISGLIVDYVGGRQMFLFGMVATVACTAAFGLSSSMPVLLAIWAANRFFNRWDGTRWSKRRHVGIRPSGRPPSWAFSR